MVCEGCGAIYSHRRWTRKGEMKRDSSAPNQTAQCTLCPACKQERDGVPGGLVYLKGDFLIKHHDEIEHLLRNEAERDGEDNPLARIMGWDDPWDKKRKPREAIL